ncbi:MAG: hypothetical protein ACC628_13120, partial [Pirellulaceae bacterium]
MSKQKHETAIEVAALCAAAQRQSFEAECKNRLSSRQRTFLGELGAKQHGNFFDVQLGGSTAQLSISGEAIHIGLIQTMKPDRGKGHASKLLKHMCECADHAQVQLTGNVEAK